MTKRHEVLAVAVLLPGILVLAPLTRIAADDARKAPDALATTRAFLNFAFTGQAKAAAELGDPGKSYNREEKIKKGFEKGLETKKPPAIVRFLTTDKNALAITEAVVSKNKKQGAGPLSIRLVKKDKRWLIYDVDMGKEQADKNLERFQRQHPKAEVVIPKKDK